MLYDFSALRTMFLDYLDSQLFEEEPVGLYEPINYIMQLGGKRVRPISTLIGTNVFSEDVKKALPLAYAFELFHNFTLAHDDVMDQAEIRRGQPAMHIKYSLNNAILSGDAMLIQAYKFILESGADPELTQKILSLFSETAIEICIGQQMDMDFETMEEVELAKYLLMIKYKTGVLLAASLKAGALMGGASEENADHLYSFGLNIGLAFQIRDDVLDLYADQSDFGKKVGGDILQKKKTYLYLKSLELAGESKKKELISLYNSDHVENEKKISAVKVCFDQLDVLKFANELTEELTENASTHLRAISVSEDRLTQLKYLSQLLLDRKS